MNNLYLIAHIARGEPTFDIAERQRCSNCQGVGGHMVPDFETGVVTDYEGSSCDECDGVGYWWILSTCGYRAYPYAHWSLDLELNGYPPTTVIKLISEPKPPEGALDCFAINDCPSRSAIATGAASLLSMLGLVKPKPTIKRRM